MAKKAAKKKPTPASEASAPIADVAAPPPAPAAPAKAAGTPLWARAAVCVAALVAFGRSFSSPLLATWDDQRFLYDSDVLHPSFSGLVSFFTEQRYEAYHPLHLLSYWIDVPWAGPSGPVVHVTSAILWCVVLVVALEVFRKLGLGLPSALVATIAFGIHPVMVEAVAWGSGRKDVLAIGFALGALLFHLRSASWKDRDAWISRGLFVLGVLSKTSVITLPVALFAADLWLARRSVKDAAIAQLPSLAVAAGLSVIVVLIWRGHAMLRGDTGDEIGVEPLVVPATFSHQLFTVLWPDSVSPVYPTSHDLSFPLWFAVLGPAALVLGLTWTWMRRTEPAAQRAGLGLTWFIVLLLPVSNLLPMYFQWQDRYVAASAFGLALVLGTVLEMLATNDARETWIRTLVSGAVAIVPLGARTIEYVGVWRSDRTLWHHATFCQPSAYYAWIKLAEARRADGEYDGALAALVQAIDLEPRTRLGYATFVYVLALRDERDEHLEGESHAMQWSVRYIEASDDASGLRDMAADMLDDGYHDAATFVLGRSLDLEPVDDDRLERAVAHHLRGGREWLARFYLERMTRRPVMPLVVSFFDAERLRRGYVTEEELLHEAEDVVLPGEERDPEEAPLPDVEGSGFDTAIDLRE